MAPTTSMFLTVTLENVNEGTQWCATSNKSGRIVVSQSDPHEALRLALIDAGAAPDNRRDVKARIDCSGGMPCTDCPSKKACQRGCRRQPEFISHEYHDRKDLRAECDAVDTLLRGLGLDPERCRTEGGALNARRALSLLADGAQAEPVARDGWKSVPVEPTSNMLAAMSGEWHSSRHDAARKQYAAALAASPAQPAREPTA